MAPARHQGALFDAVQPDLFSVREATFGHADDRPVYRYDLRRAWGDPTGRVVNFVMLNPSTADAERDDQTIRRCVAFARSWVFDALVVTNLYAFRATHPEELWEADEPVGPRNDEFLLRHARGAGLVVCAWGNHGSPGWGRGPSKRGRGPVVLEMLRAAGIRPHCLRMTGLSQPAHPLYLPADLSPTPME